MADDDKGGDKEKDKEKGGAGSADLDARILAQAKAMLAERSAEQVTERLIREAHSARERARAAEARIPAEGAVVLTGDDAAAWSKYRELGAPADLRKAVAERDTFKKEADDFRGDAKIREVADLTFPGKAKVLARLIAADEVEIVDGKDRDGKPARVAMVKAKAEGGTAVPLLDHIRANHAEFLPALSVAESSRTSPGTPPRNAGGGPPPPPDADNEYRAQQMTGRYAVL